MGTPRHDFLPITEEQVQVSLLGVFRPGCRNTGMGQKAVDAELFGHQRTVILLWTPLELPWFLSLPADQLYLPVCEHPASLESKTKTKTVLLKLIRAGFC